MSSSDEYAREVERIREFWGHLRLDSYLSSPGVWVGDILDALEMCREHVVELAGDSVFLVEALDAALLVELKGKEEA